MNRALAIVPALFCLNGFSQGFKSFYSPLNTGAFISAINHTDLGTSIATETQAWGQGGKEVLLFKLDNGDDVLWQRCYGNGSDNSVYAMDTIAADDYILCGYEFDGMQSDAILLRIDQDGDTVWTKKLSTIDNEALYDVKRFDNTSFVACGHSGGLVFERKMFISKFDNNGVMQWCQGFENGDQAVPWKLWVADGFIYLMAYQSSSIGPGVDIIKLDNSGQIVWQYRYTKTGFYSMGLSLFGIGVSDLVFAGYVQDMSDPNDLKSFYTRIDSAGDISWSKQFKDSLVAQTVLGTYAMRDLSDNILITGLYSDPGMNGKMLCAKIDAANGNLLWEHGYTPGTSSQGNLVLTKPSATVWIGASVNSVTGINNPNLLRTDVNGYNPCNHVMPSLEYGKSNFIRTTDSMTVAPFVLDQSSTGYSIGVPDMHDSVFCSTIGVNEVGQPECLDLYPNPAQNTVTLSACAGLKKLEIYDASGRCVYMRKENERQSAISLQGFLKGIYCIRIEAENGTMTKKLVIE